MNKIEAIRRGDDISRTYDTLKARSDRDYLFSKLTIHSGMKITELLTIIVEDIKRLTEEGILSGLCKVHYHSLIKVRLPGTLSNELLHYIKNKSLSNEDVLFQSLRTNQVLPRQQAYRITHQAAIKTDIENVGLTTLRKTFAYHTYQKSMPVPIIQKYLGH